MNNAPYDLIASEYYEDSHKTSRNFDEASRYALTSLREMVPPVGLVLDVGAGRGRCIEFLGLDPNRIVQLDNSREMLALQPREESLLQVHHNAESLPFLNDVFSCVTAFLCDPYLGLTFLKESFRVLKRGGSFIGTTPSFEWGAPLRKDLNLSSGSTRFITRDSGKVIVPSTLLPKLQLREMLLLVGFQEVNISTHRLPQGTKIVSPDIEAPAKRLGCDVFELEILYVIHCAKR